MVKPCYWLQFTRNTIFFFQLRLYFYCFLFRLQNIVSIRLCRCIIIITDSFVFFFNVNEFHSNWFNFSTVNHFGSISHKTLPLYNVCRCRFFSLLLFECDNKRKCFVFLLDLTFLPIHVDIFLVFFYYFLFGRGKNNVNWSRKQFKFST